MEIYITEKDEGRRCDRFMKKLLPGAASSFIYRMFRKKDVKVNGKRVDVDYILQKGDCLQFYLTQEYYSQWKKDKVNQVKGTLDLVYEDDHILVVYKPQGERLLAQEGKTSLTEKVQWYLRDYETATFTPSPLHRLDTNTQGLVAYAKTYRAARKISEMFALGKVVRKYLAVVEGNFYGEKEVLVNLVKKDKKVFVKEEGSQAISLIKSLENRDNKTLVQVELKTGKTHQIRVTMEHLGHPVVGDMKYGSGGKGQQLCSYYLSFENLTLVHVGEDFYRRVQEAFHGQTLPVNTHPIRRLQL